MRRGQDDGEGATRASAYSSDNRCGQWFAAGLQPIVIRIGFLVVVLGARVSVYLDHEGLNREGWRHGYRKRSAA